MDNSRKIQDLISQEGWTLVDEWMNRAEENITVALKDFVNVKADEQQKWINFYAGQLEVVRKFKMFIKSNLEVKDKKQIKKIGL